MELRRKIRRCTKLNSDDNNDDDDYHLPVDLIGEVLSRLPAKSIMRCRFASKLLSSVTATPDFINSLATRSPRSLVLVCRNRGQLFVVSSQVNGEMENHQFTFPCKLDIRCCESVHGLLYVVTPTQLLIWNPLFKRFFDLPKLEEEGKFRDGFLGYDPVSGKYKALCILGRGETIRILTLGPHESWRVLSKGFHVRSYTTGCGRCINGVIYYESCSPSEGHAIISFDLRSEKFALIKCPPEQRRSFFWVSYQGRLAIVRTLASGAELCVLEDAQTHHWIYKHFTLRLRPKFLSWKLVAITDAGEFVYTRKPDIGVFGDSEYQTGLHRWFSVVYLDPGKNTEREVLVRGIKVNNVRRPDETGFSLMNLSVIPNHFDSLMSM